MRQGVLETGEYRWIVYIYASISNCTCCSHVWLFEGAEGGELVKNLERAQAASDASFEGEPLDMRQPKRARAS